MSLKKLFSRSSSKKGVVDYSARRSMIEAPPPGHVTDRHDPHKLIWKPQFSTGDQSEESRVAFYNCGFSACLRCGNFNVVRFEERAGVRQNGETYGTETFRCLTAACKWKTSYKFDDGASSYYPETKGWPRGIHFYPISFMELWCDRHQLSELLDQISSRNLDGDAFLALFHSGQMQEALGVGSKTISKIKKALEQRDGAVLVRPKTPKKKKK